MINEGTLAELSPVEMLLRALPMNSRVIAEIKVLFDPKVPSTFS